jgi:phosphate acyltransferase
VKKQRTSESRLVTVAVDTVGGDHAPSEVLAGVTLALAEDPSLHVLVTGPSKLVTTFANTNPRIEAVPTTEVIGMDEQPATAVRTKKDSSIVVGCRLVKQGRADAFFSAGSTGACMAAATLIMGRVKGVQRPAIATVMPTAGPPCVMLDVGANADCRPEHLLQFAFMGAAYASVVLGVIGPRVALLNIGEEPSKGSSLAQASHRLIAEKVPNFIGNIEGRDVLAGVTDVIVTDGFTGNVALKLLEGTSKILLGQVRNAITGSPVAKTAAAVLRPALNRLKDRLDPDTYGGAPLLGVQGVCIIGHGTSKARAVSNAIRVAAQAGRGGLTEQIEQAVAQN